MHCRRSLLFCDGDAWSKKDDSRFDVTMGAYDGAEVCELVGLFLLHHLSLLLGKEAVGLYRDDGLAIIRNASGPEADKTRKQVEKIFQQHNLKVIADTNLIQTDFLDVVLNLNTGKFSPFRKPNDNPLYINIRSNHPPTITKHLPLMIEKRISQISYDKSEFHRATPTYEQAFAKEWLQCQAFISTSTSTRQRKETQQKTQHYMV